MFERDFEVLIEPAKKYIESYPARVQEFIFEFEGYETEFIERELLFFDLVERYIEDREGWVYPMPAVDKALKHLDEDNIIYPLRRKIGFLVEKQKSITSNNPRTEINTPLPQTGRTNERGLSANEYALIYILDLLARGENIPTDPISGALLKKKIEQIGKEVFELLVQPDSFYRAVKNIYENFDLKKKSDLNNLSKRWLHVVTRYSRNWPLTEAYLKTNFLIESHGENPGES